MIEDESLNFNFLSFSTRSVCDGLTHAAEIFISRLMWETEASVPLTHTEYLRLQRQNKFPNPPVMRPVREQSTFVPHH